MNKSSVTTAVIAISFSLFFTQYSVCLAESTIYGVNDNGGSVTYGGSTIVNGDGGSVVIIDGQVVSGGSSSAVVGKGPIKTEIRKIPAYSAVKIEAPVDMVYTVSPVVSMKISAPGNILPMVVTTAKNGQLTLKLKKSVVMKQPIHVLASGPSLDSITTSASGSFRGIGLTGRSLRLDISGSGRVEASGQVDKVEISVSGSGDVDASKVRARQAKIEISGSGDVWAYASSSVSAEIAGSGNVIVTGKPSQRSVNSYGSGTVSFR